MVMSIKDLEDSLREIEDASSDYEAAHSMEDDLREDVLREIADGNPLSVELAKLVLTSSEIDFVRYCS